LKANAGGIIFVYEDGSRRAIGLCQPTDEHQVYRNPKTIHMWGSVNPYFPYHPWYFWRVQFTSITLDSYDDELERSFKGWKAAPLEGYIKLWYDIGDADSRLVITPTLL